MNAFTVNFDLLKNTNLRHTDMLIYSVLRNRKIQTQTNPTVLPSQLQSQFNICPKTSYNSLHRLIEAGLIVPMVDNKSLHNIYDIKDVDSDGNAKE